MRPHTSSLTAIQPGRRLWLPGLAASPAGVRLCVVVLLVAAWQMVASYSDRLFIAPPSEVAISIWKMFGQTEVMGALAHTLWELVVAFTVAAIAGAVLGLLVGRSAFFKATLYPIVLFLYSLPQAPILPLFVLAFGIGAASKIAFGISHGIFPMIITVAAGVRDIDPGLLKFARSAGARPSQVLWAIVLPAATASFFTGLRMCMTGVLLGVLLAELFVSQAGVGFYTRRFTDSFQAADLFALISMLAAIAVTLNEFCRIIENRFHRWRA